MNKVVLQAEVVPEVSKYAAIIIRDTVICTMAGETLQPSSRR